MKISEQDIVDAFKLLRGCQLILDLYYCPDHNKLVETNGNFYNGMACIGCDLVYIGEIE